MVGTLNGIGKFEQWIIVKPHLEAGTKQSDIAEMFGVSRHLITKIKRVGMALEEVEFPTDNGKYIIKGGEYRPDISLVDEIFGMYSKSGLDWASSQVRIEKGLTGTEWYMIHRHFGLSKECDILSPNTLEANKGQETSIIDSVLENLNKKYRSKMIRSKQVAYVKRKYDRVISKEKEKQDLIDDVRVNLAELFSELPPQKLEITKAKTKGVPIVVSIADPHINALTKGLLATTDHSNEIVERRLDELAERVNAMESSEVELTIAGDLIESFMGDNHKNSWMGLEPGMYGARGLFEARRILCEFIAKVQNVKRVHCVTGNHDRATADNKMDVRGEVGLILYQLMDETFPKLDFNIHDHVVNFMTGDVCHIVFHGHTGASHKAKKKNSVEAKMEALKYAREFPNKYMILYTAHYHEFRIFHEDTDYMSLCLPSIFSGNSYSERLGFTSLPGALVTKINNGLPTIERITLS